MNRDLRTVRDENMLLKQSIKSLNAQSESILAGCLKRLQQQDMQMAVFTRKMNNLCQSVDQVSQVQENKRRKIENACVQREDKLKIQISKLDKALETTNSRLEESNQTQERIKAENQVLQSEIQEKED